MGKVEQTEESLRLAIEAFSRVRSWMRKRSFKGLDPYDLQELWLYRKSRELPWPFDRAASRVWRFLERHVPVVTRRCLGVAPKIAATTMALVSRSSLLMWRLRESSDDLKLSKECLDWLLGHPGAGMGEGKLGWGLPFNWYAGTESKRLVPANTPLSTVCNDAGHAFLDIRDYTGEIEFLGYARQVGQFLVSDLNRFETSDGSLCFSYGPTDNSQVINASLGTAAFLTRLAAVNGNEEMMNLARRARRYAIRHQQADSSWTYRGYKDNPGRIDNYHSGMNLQWLCMVLGDDFNPEEEESLKRGAEFYMEKMFDEDGAPRFLPSSRYPINILSCAQALVTFRYLHEAGIPGALDSLIKTFYWTLEHMRNRDGTFAYLIQKGSINRTPHMRWGQGWMLWGLANAIKAFRDSNSNAARLTKG